MSIEVLIPVISAVGWNRLRDEARRNRPCSGVGVRLKWTDDSVTVSAAPDAGERHPWQITPRWRASGNSGNWVGTVEPGFVNGLDTTIRETRELDGAPREVQVPLTDEHPPELVFSSFRDPAAFAGLSATMSGQLIALPGEGYPEWFETIGVRPAAARRRLGDEPTPDPTRTREIRACDVVLVTPRMAVRQRVEVGDATTAAQSVRISADILSDALNANPYHRLVVLPKWTPFQMPSDFQRLMGDYIESQTDERLIATVYFVSPPGAGSAAQPDESWEVYPVYSTFWNLAHAPASQVPQRKPEPLTFNLPLAAGVGQSVINAILSPINDALEQTYEFLNALRFEGGFWTPSGIGVDDRPAPPVVDEDDAGGGLDTAKHRHRREALEAEARSAIEPLNPAFPYRRLPLPLGYLRFDTPGRRDT